MRWRDRLADRNRSDRQAGEPDGRPLQLAHTRWIVWLLTGVAGVHRDRQVLHFSAETFPRWFSRRAGPVARMCRSKKLRLVFASCLVNYQVTDVGQGDRAGAWRRTASRSSCRSSAAAACPHLILGTLGPSRQAVRANVASLHQWVSQGYDVVVPVASCSLMLKREYPELHPDEPTKAGGPKHFDVCEYLMKMKKDGRLVDRFRQESWPRRVSDPLPSSRSEYRIQIERADGMRRRTRGGDREVLGA